MTDVNGEDMMIASRDYSARDALSTVATLQGYADEVRIHPITVDRSGPLDHRIIARSGSARGREGAKQRRWALAPIWAEGPRTREPDVFLGYTVTSTERVNVGDGYTEDERTYCRYARYGDALDAIESVVKMNTVANTGAIRTWERAQRGVFRSSAYDREELDAIASDAIEDWVATFNTYGLDEWDDLTYDTVDQHFHDEVLGQALSMDRIEFWELPYLSVVLDDILPEEAYMADDEDDDEGEEVDA